MKKKTKEDRDGFKTGDIIIVTIWLLVTVIFIAMLILSVIGLIKLGLNISSWTY